MSAEELQDRLDGVTAELATALTGGHDPNPYLPKDWQRPKPDLSKQFKLPREGIDY